MKSFICSCVNPDLKELGVKNINEFTEFIDNAESINKKEFLNNCYVEDSLKLDFKTFPNDFDFFRNGEIIFFTNSMIEHFFK